MAPRARFVDRRDIKLALISMSGQSGTVAILGLTFAIGMPGGIVTFTEGHRTGRFTIKEQFHAFRAAGMSVTHDELGISGRGLFVGMKDGLEA